MCVLPLKKEQCSLETILLNFLEQRTKQPSSNRLYSCTGMFHVCKYDNAPVCLWETEWQTWAAFSLIVYFQATWDPSFFRLVLYIYFVPAAHPAHRGPKQRERDMSEDASDRQRLKDKPSFSPAFLARSVGIWELWILLLNKCLFSPPLK